MKILIIKPSSFGDIIQANPIIQAIKSTWQEAEIDWLVFNQWQDVIKLFADIKNIKVWNRKGGIKAFFDILKDCNKQNYDLVIDLQGLLRTALFARLLNAKQKIGVSGMKELSWLLLKEPYKKNKNENAVIRNLKSLSYITNKNYNVKFNIVADENLSNEILEKENIGLADKIVAFMPYARGKTKSWQTQKYIELASMIKNIDNDIKIIVLGSQNDYGKIKSQNIVDLCGKTNILQLASILKKCKFVVGSDTGSMHLANAIGTNSAFIFGGSDIKETSPYGNNSITISANLGCSPCRGKCKYNSEKCLEQITPDMVFKSIEKWIK
jgi:lipopolysaccharide heptosyltransferase II